MDCKERLESYLRENNVPYQVQPHVIAYTAQEVAAIEHVPGRQLAKVVMVIADGEMRMLVAPASRQVSISLVEAAMDAEDVRLATEEEFGPLFPDCEIGAMPPFGNLYEVPVYVDTVLAENETIVFQAGSHTETISIKYTDFARLVEPTVAQLCSGILIAAS